MSLPKKKGVGGGQVLKSDFIKKTNKENNGRQLAKDKQLSLFQTRETDL